MGVNMGKLPARETSARRKMGKHLFLLQETGNESILPCDRPLVNNLSSISARPVRFSFIFSRFGFSSNQEICMSCSLQWREIR